jgi:hypothetical protein
VATFICYEDILPAFVNRMMKHGEPALLVNLTNDAWFGDSTEPWIHMALSKLRAVEHRRFFVRSTNSGVSAFVDPIGRTLATTPTFSEIAIAEDLKWLDLETPYQLWGDAPWWLLSMVSLGLALVRRRPPLPKPAPPANGTQNSADAGADSVGSAGSELARAEFEAAPRDAEQSPQADETPPEEPSSTEPDASTSAEAPSSAEQAQPPAEAPASQGAGDEPESGTDARPDLVPDEAKPVGATPRRDSSEFGHFPKPPTKS